MCFRDGGEEKKGNGGARRAEGSLLGDQMLRTRMHSSQIGKKGNNNNNHEKNKTIPNGVNRMVRNLQPRSGSEKGKKRQ